MSGAHGRRRRGERGECARVRVASANHARDAPIIQPSHGARRHARAGAARHGGRGGAGCGGAPK